MTGYNQEADYNKEAAYPTNAPPPPPPAGQPHTAVPMAAVPEGYKLQAIETPEDDTEKYWLHLVFGVLASWFFGFLGLIGLCFIEKPRQKKFFGLGCAIGIAVWIITWTILYFVVFASWGRATASIIAAAGANTNTTSIYA